MPNGSGSEYVVGITDDLDGIRMSVSLQGGKDDGAKL